jgi:pimeloyl-ACP methyl ester carboxylesterase
VGEGDQGRQYQDGRVLKRKPDVPQLVFIHGPGAGACPDASVAQLKHFPGSVAPKLPGPPEGQPCPDVARYTEWLRGWLWARGLNSDLVLVGYTLGSCIALQYGLDYPDEVRGIVAATIAMRSKGIKPEAFEMRRRAAESEKAFEEWVEYQRRAMYLVDPALREQLLERHRQIGPLSQFHSLKAVNAFDVSDRISTLKPRLLLLHGLDDPVGRLNGLADQPEYEREISEAVAGSQYIRLPGAGHFPFTEAPEKTNRLIGEFLATL